MTVYEPHWFQGRQDRECEICKLPDQDPIHIRIPDGASVTASIEPQTSALTGQRAGAVPTSLRIRCPFRVLSQEPRLVLGKDQGDRQVRFAYDGGHPPGVPLEQREVGYLEVVLSARDAAVFVPGRLVSIEISLPPASPLFARETG